MSTITNKTRTEARGNIRTEGKIAETLRSVRRFHQSEAIRSLLRRILAFGVYTAVVTVVQLNFMRLDIKIDTIFLTLLGTLLSLLLVFRTNAAYDRFWEGRKLWGGLVNNARSFAMMADAMLPQPSDDDTSSLAAQTRADRAWFARYIAAFAVALKGHLRDNFRSEDICGEPGSEDELDARDCEQVPRVQHVPNYLAKRLFGKIEELHRTGRIDRYAVLNVKPHHAAFVETIGACERIKRTPIPYSYNFYIKLFISLYLGIIPFMLIDKYGYYTILAVMMAGYALMGIEMIASEIEEPFGLDANDLPLDQMALTIRLNVHEILEVEPPASNDALTMQQ
jgi:ion channel-forming bestrophin family protein